MATSGPLDGEPWNSVINCESARAGACFYLSCVNHHDLTKEGLVCASGCLRRYLPRQHHLTTTKYFTSNRYHGCWQNAGDGETGTSARLQPKPPDPWRSRTGGSLQGATGWLCIQPFPAATQIFPARRRFPSTKAGDTMMILNVVIFSSVAPAKTKVRLCVQRPNQSHPGGTW